MSSRADDLLYDSQATLRLVDTQLEELCGQPGSAAAAPAVTGMAMRQERAPAPPVVELSSPAAPPPVAATQGAALQQVSDATLAMPGIVVLPQILERASFEIVSLLRSLRESRMALEHATSSRIQQAHEKLKEVSSATEVAATDILDACDRVQSLVDELESDEAEPQPGRAATIRQTMRDEVFMMMGALQFQDITTQQLNHAASTLADMESRLADIVRLFDLQTLGIGAEGSAPVFASHPDTFAPDATVRNAETRQALADALVAGQGKG